jgi:hypothetical protein
MDEPHPTWKRLTELARGAPSDPSPMPAGFADRVLARLPARAARAESAAMVRLVLGGALAASLLALAAGWWCRDAVAAEVDRGPVALEQVLPLEPTP